MKPVFGSFGKGVELAYSVNAIVTRLEQNKNGLLIQQYISPGKRQDERYIVIGDRVVNAMLRVAQPGEVATNMHHGGSGYPLSWDGETEVLCVAAAKSVGLLYAGVDVIRDEQGKPYLLEINSNPHTDVIDISGHNHFIDMLKYLKETT